MANGAEATLVGDRPELFCLCGADTLEREARGCVAGEAASVGEAWEFAVGEVEAM